jgi:hypothetical protein
MNTSDFYHVVIKPRAETLRAITNYDQRINHDMTKIQSYEFDDSFQSSDQLHSLYQGVIEKYQNGELSVQSHCVLFNLTFDKFVKWIKTKNNKP